MPRWLLLVLILGGLLYFSTPALLKAYTIPSGSMRPTLQIGDYMLARRAAYDLRLETLHIARLRDPQHNDVAVFRSPHPPNKVFVSRVIGIPGDTIAIQDKQVYRNGEALHEPFTRHSDPDITVSPRDNVPPVTLQEGQYFMMGDDRDDSLDSRFTGPVPRENSLGKAWIIYAHTDASGLSFDRAGTRIK